MNMVIHQRQLMLKELIGEEFQHTLVEKSAVTSLPFTTNFNIGNGYDFYVDGNKVSTQDWNNRSLNDIMPTYRWVISNEENNNVKADIDYTTAYYGGNSIKLLSVT